MLGHEKPSFAPLTGEFTDPGLEREFRNHYFGESRWLIGLSFSILAAALVVFTVNDLRVEGAGPFSIVLLLCRIAFLITCAILLLNVNKLSARAVDYWLFVVLCAVGAFQLVVETTRPASYTGYIGISVMFIQTIYVVIPIPMRLQFAAAFSFSIGEMIVFKMFHADAHPLNHLTIPLSLFVANVIGVVVARRFAQFRRTQFHMMLSEKEGRRLIEEAMANIRTLSGLLPICSRCKKVRDDRGYWNTVETYISEHSNAEFSHGFCPTCLEHELTLVDEFAREQSRAG